MFQLPSNSGAPCPLLADFVLTDSDRNEKKSARRQKVFEPDPFYRVDHSRTVAARYPPRRHRHPSLAGTSRSSGQRNLTHG